ncbi:hypothetical protein ACGFZK_19795 [Streptomyces sp. NPDC048257]|uniref:DUF7737 domain-containing protein n=1 Tax=Streptomyces sp. NPDC048257 TaxID=3365526 RepID=UPI0037220E10
MAVAGETTAGGRGDGWGLDVPEERLPLREVIRRRAFREVAAGAYGGEYTMVLRDGRDPVDPLPLTEVPALVLSEVLRDVGLFVGAAGVGNDPAWFDGGPEGRFREYWTSYGFGELNQSAETRRVLSERLVPRPAIADRCTFQGRFLHVRGELRTYRIHLGSGNVLMAPDDRYLCIVPGGAGAPGTPRPAACPSRGTAPSRSSSPRPCCSRGTRRSPTRRSPASSAADAPSPAPRGKRKRERERRRPRPRTNRVRGLRREG